MDVLAQPQMSSYHKYNKDAQLMWKQFVVQTKNELQTMCVTTKRKFFMVIRRHPELFVTNVLYTGCNYTVGQICTCQMAINYKKRSRRVLKRRG